MLSAGQAFHCDWCAAAPTHFAATDMLARADRFSAESSLPTERTIAVHILHSVEVCVSTDITSREVVNHVGG
jgi:hypothetical protein